MSLRGIGQRLSRLSSHFSETVQVPFVRDHRRLSGASFSSPSDGTFSPDDDSSQFETRYDLPSEVWARVFRHVTTIDVQHGSELLFDTQQPLHLTHVSKLWRDIALTTPELWTNVNLSSANRAFTFLQRSGNAQLCVIFRSDRDAPVEYPRLELLISCAERVRVLHIYIHSSSRAWDYLTRFRAPKLMSLAMWPRYADDAEGPLRLNASAHLYVHAPRLREICMNYVQVPLQSSVFAQPGLTHLTLRKVAFVDYNSRRLYDILTTVAESLTELELSFDPRWTRAVEPFPLLLPLPKLQALRLDCRPSAIRNLLASLFTPASIQVHSSAWEASELRRVLPDDLSRLTSLRRANHVEMRVWDLPLLTVKAFDAQRTAESPIEVLLQDEASEPLFELDLNPKNNRSGILAFDNVWKIFQPHNITSLSVTTDFKDGRKYARNWEALLCAAVYLEVLSFQGGGLSGLLSVLSSNSSPSEDSSAAIPLPCANLQVLAIRLWCRDGFKSRWTIDLLSKLACFLSERSKLDNALSQLIINCPRSYLRELDMFVDMKSHVERLTLEAP